MHDGFLFGKDKAVSHDIKIGTLVGVDNVDKVIPLLIEKGFETVSITFFRSCLHHDLAEVAKRVNNLIGDSGMTVSSVSMFGNPLTDGEFGDNSRESLKRVIDAAPLFNTDLVTGFAGRLIDTPLEESLPMFKKVWGEFAKQAEDKGLKIAFENCNMGGSWNQGDWNMAFTPKMWTEMFNILPNDNVGLQWEPCHQMVQLVDPIPQLRKWVKKIFNVHGKDATIAWDVIKEYGIYSNEEFVWHRTPGFGDSNWTDIISILRMNGFKGSIDIEGFHDPVYREELEYTGQVYSLEYLKRCRGGEFVANPTL